MPRPGADRNTCRDFSRSSRLEWLETNGAGAFAMGTVAGVNTRRYHALLAASPDPPASRRVLLSRIEETALLAGRECALGVCQYPGVVTPRGFELLDEFQAEPHASWRYNLDGAPLEKQVYLLEGRPAVVIRYRSDRALRLRLRPFLADRDYHSLRRAGDPVPELQFRGPAGFDPDPHWYNNIEYLRELDRGLDFREDLYTPGVFTLDLAPNEWAPLCASIHGDEPAAPPERADPFLVRRGDGKPTLIAGYPWFTDWGRDTMIALPGLLIARGRLDQAREIIEGFLACRSQGLIPNRFPDSGITPEFNTADATLWMFQAVRALLAASADRTFLKNVFYPAAREILDWHWRGTFFGIRADPADSLLSAGAPGAQLTWMDAKVGDWVITPRRGKPVEINALWHGAVSLMAEWARELGDSSAAQFAQQALQIRDSFRSKFWNPQRQCLYDVLGAPEEASQLRPNQIFAVSLDHDLLTPAQQQAVTRIVEKELLTPVGLRTLDRRDPAYKPHYDGGPAQRDAAYHQGTVWPWLLGPFLDAYLIAFGKTQESLAYCRGLLERLESRAGSEGCLGSICEIYDAEEPRLPRGCPAQAWSVAEIARVKWANGWS